MESQNTSSAGGSEIRVLARFGIRAELEALTGLFIGGPDTGLTIGGADQTVVRNGLSNEPYVPGSSLKGKMRSLIERTRGLPLDLLVNGKTRLDQRKIHLCKDQPSYDRCQVCNIFGFPPKPKVDITPHPTRLVVRDASLTKASADQLRSRTGLPMPMTEIKAEAAIDRLTSAATPRQRERVPAGACFGVAMAYTAYLPADLARFAVVFEALDLVERDYLGGQGSRGYGQVLFRGLTVDAEWVNLSASDRERLDQRLSAARGAHDEARRGPPPRAFVEAFAGSNGQAA